MSQHNIVLPSELKAVKEEGNKGIYEIDGLYPGYGHTLGNSLRRIILSSLPGAAIIAVKIKGADHEFTTLDGVKEDVINILLNLKQVRFQVSGEGIQTVTVKVTSKKEVTGADIDVSGGVEVLNPEQYICEVTGKDGFEAEIMVDTGLGFVSKDKLNKDKVDAGTIFVDAVFTPIRKVNYEVENTRVGDRTDFNKLRINIETDGTMTPKEALEDSMKIMLTQLKTMLSLSEQDYEELTANIEIPVPVAELQEELAEEEADVTDILKTRIDSVDFSTRTLNALSDANIRTLGGLVQKTESDLSALDGIGAKGIEEIKTILEDSGLALKS
jgi:DNA-directed RNA polymerase subunit alpha